MIRVNIVFVIAALSIACGSGDATPAVVRTMADTTPPPAAAGEVEQYSAMELDSIVRALGARSTAGFGRTHATFHYVEARRVASGTPEIHDDWIDVVVVQSGHGKVLTGGHVTGSHVESAGEHRGGTIGGGTTRTLGPGDLMIIPTGVPHQYQIAPGDSLRYLTIKIHR